LRRVFRCLLLVVSKRAQLPLGLFVMHITFANSPGSSRGKMDVNREYGKRGKQKY